MNFPSARDVLLCLCDPDWFYIPDDIWRGLQHEKLLVINFILPLPSPSKAPKAQTHVFPPHPILGQP